MERHSIADFAIDPVDGVIWVLLERAPSPAWTAALELVVVDGVSGAAVTADGRRLSLPARHLDETDALGALLALVEEANRAASALAPGRPPGGR